MTNISRCAFPVKWEYAVQIRKRTDTVSRLNQYTKKEKVKSVGNGMTFRQDLVGEEDVRSGIYALSDSVAGTFTPKNMKCTTVQILIKDPQFKSMSL